MQTELTIPINLDASVGRESRMDAIKNKVINGLAHRVIKSILQSWLPTRTFQELYRLSVSERGAEPFFISK